MIRAGFKGLSCGSSPIMIRIFVAVAVLGSTFAVAADDKKEDRKAVKDTELKKESSSGPAKGLAGDIERKKTETGKAAPALQYDQFRLGVESQVASKRTEQITDLKKIIGL